MIRFIIASIFIIGGLFVFAVATFGLFKYKYVLNRMHVAAECDTLAALLIIIGCIILTGFTFHSLKFVLIICFLWLASPVASHMIAKTEITTNKSMKRKCEVINNDDI